MSIAILTISAVWIFLACRSFVLLKKYRIKKDEINQNPAISKEQKPKEIESHYDSIVKDNLFGFSVKSFNILITNALLVVITTIGVYVSSESFKEQSLLNREQYRLEYKKERAYVTLLNFKDVSLSDKHVLRFTFHNSGHTSAQKNIATLYYHEDLSNPQKRQKLFDIFSDIDNFAKTGVTIPPDRDWFQAIELQNELLDKFQNESAVELEIKYIDYLDKPRTSSTLLRYSEGKFEAVGNKMD